MIYFCNALKAEQKIFKEICDKETQISLLSHSLIFCDLGVVTPSSLASQEHMLFYHPAKFSCE